MSGSKAIDFRGWIVLSIPVFLVALWAAFMIGEMAVSCSGTLAWPAKKVLCPADTTPDITRTSETWRASNQTTYSDNKWELVCRSKSGDQHPSGVFWVQIGAYLLVFFPLFFVLMYFAVKKWVKI